ncbi:MAG: DedA family protein [Patescibacteria group bacterium]
MADLVSLIQAAGYLGIFGAVLFESGVPFGFFLPGDSLLFSVGFLASQDIFSFPLLVLGIFIMAVAGNSIGYALGHKLGPLIFTKEDSLFFHKDHVKKAERFSARHGKKAVILARFLPIFRTFVPIVAGVGTMPYRTFLTYNIIGSALWTVSITGLGYFLGSIIPGIDRYLLPIVIAIIIVTLVPSAWELYKSKK